MTRLSQHRLPQRIRMSDREPQQDARVGERRHRRAAQGGRRRRLRDEVRGGELPHAGVRRHRPRERQLPDAPVAQRMSCRGTDGGQEGQVRRGDAVLR